MGAACIPPLKGKYHLSYFWRKHYSSFMVFYCGCYKIQKKIFVHYWMWKRCFFKEGSSTFSMLATTMETSMPFSIKQLSFKVLTSLIALTTFMMSLKTKMSFRAIGKKWEITDKCNRNMYGGGGQSGAVRLLVLSVMEPQGVILVGCAAGRMWLLVASAAHAVVYL